LLLGQINVISRDNILCLSISEDSDEQSIKTVNARRLVPVHSKLLELGFHQFLNQRRKQGSNQLFTCTATGGYNEWAKNFERRFDRYLKKLGFIAGKRPTAYSFRHTMIDELQELEIPEHVVADLVGHSKKGFTFRHYGKKTSLKRLKEVIESLHFKDELDAVTK
jgi:integrase